MIKVSMFFQGTPPVAGWSETLYYPGTSTLGAKTAFEGSTKGLRLGLSKPDITMIGARFSVVGVRRITRVVRYTTANVGTWTSLIATTEPWSAILMKLRNGDALEVNHFVHGVPGDQITTGAYTPTGGFTTAANAYLSDIMANYRLWARNPAIVGSPKMEWVINDSAFAKLTEHRVGRPFDLLVGRRAGS